ncbi:3-hydroxybutyryl-CoA dehydrogenase [Roseivivax isoporae]|uniref:L-gulonate 3-dehydrogenase n=1 Tax=Roseivivax isoporae LMG 25204 TaxID=1449351 RepID=X7FDV7_9RHOB|nr:3-hydroxybutyryl-CoA dehydrogenase [Roseivivax isoporae]ETX30261.1 3-hydroxybutyryl-CoA dehydrogenase [Roseivivax isoporae LMG 25204]
MIPAAACIGAGRMGRGIAQALAYGGGRIALLDSRPRGADAFAAYRDDVLAEVQAGLEMVARLGGFDADAVPALMARVSVHPLSDAARALGGAEIVYEAVPEIRAAKAEAFGLFDAHADADAILASTTSTMLSTDLAALTSRPERFLNAHWLNPALLVPLVEVSPCDETLPDVTDRLCAVLEAMGKVPVLCKASPGYIVPRIQALAMNEAARLVEEGVATPEDVDRAVKYGFGLRFSVLGLLEFIDWGGGDILYHASRYMADATGEDRFAPPAIVARHMEEGAIGMKSGRGFFDYAGRDVDAYRTDRMGAFLNALRQAGLFRQPALEDPATTGTGQTATGSSQP